MTARNRIILVASFRRLTLRSHSFACGQSRGHAETDGNIVGAIVRSGAESSGFNLLGISVVHILANGWIAAMLDVLEVEQEIEGISGDAHGGDIGDAGFG